MDVLRSSSTAPMDICDRPTVVVLDRTRDGEVDTSKGTLAAIVDIKRTSSSKYSLKKELRSVRLLGLARCVVASKAGAGSRPAVVEGTIKKRLAEELQPAVGKPSYHSPVSDVVRLNQLHQAARRRHDKRRKLYSSSVAAGLDLPVVDECFAEFDDVLQEAVRRLEPFYSDGYFEKDAKYNDAEMNRLTLGSFCSLRCVASASENFEVMNLADTGSARTRYEKAIEIMDRNCWEMEKALRDAGRKYGEI